MQVKPPLNASTIPSGSISMDQLAGGARPEQQLLTNPGFNFAQRQTPGTLTTITDNTYSADQWKVTRSSADVQYQRLSNSGVSGFISANRGRFKKITNAGQIVIFQPIENLITQGLLNQTVNFQLSIQHNVGRLWRLALINWSGTADAVGAMISNFTTSPMGLNANFAYLSSYTITSGTGVEVWDISVTMPGSGISNLVIAIMIETSMLANATVDIAECHLNIGSDVRAPWYPLSAPEDLARCERYYEKSYDIDTIPGTSTALSAVDFSENGTATVTPIRYRQRKPVTPAVTLYSTTGASGNWRDITGAADVAVAAQNTGLAATAVKPSGVGGITLHEMAGHYTLDSGL